MDQLLTVNQLAEWLQVKPRTVYQWVHEGYIPVAKLGSLVRFRRASIERWLNKRELSGRAVRRLDVIVSESKAPSHRAFGELRAAGFDEPQAENWSRSTAALR